MVTANSSLPLNQTGNKYFICSLSGSQVMWQIYLYLPGPTGKIRYQNFKDIAWVLYFDLDDLFGHNIIHLYCNCKMLFFKA